MHKYRKALACLLLALFSLSASAQNNDEGPEIKAQEPVKNIVKISPFHFASSTFLMRYERMFNEQKNSFMISAGLHSRENSWNQSSNSFGFEEELQFRVYVIEPSDMSAGARNFFFFKGLYAGPYLFHRYREQDVSTWDWIAQENIISREQINEISGGVVLGAQIALGNRFFVDMWVGGGVKKSFGVTSQSFFPDITQPGFNGVHPKIGLDIGIGK